MGKELVDVKYVGHLAVIDFDPDGLGESTFVNGEMIKVSAELADSLLEQPANWVRVNTEKAAPAPVARSGATAAGKADTNAEEAK